MAVAELVELAYGRAARLRLSPPGPRRCPRRCPGCDWWAA